MTERTVTVCTIGDYGIGRRSLSFWKCSKMFQEETDWCGHEDGTNLTIKYVDVDGQSYAVNVVVPNEIDYSTDRFKVVEVGRREWVGFLFAYDVTSQDSFNKMRTMYDVAVKLCDEYLEGFSYPMMVAGLKCDLADKRVVSYSDAENLANQWKCQYVELSTKENKGVDECFEEIVRKIVAAGPNPIYEKINKPEEKKCIVM